MRPTLALRQERAIDRAYRRHVADLYRYAVAVVGDPAEAEEVVRTTFISASLRMRRRKAAPLNLNGLLAIAHDVCRRRGGHPRPVDPRAQAPVGALLCEQAERSISRQLDGRLPPAERRFLRAHLDACDDCEQFDRNLRAQRAALRALASMPVPERLQPFDSRWRRLGVRPVRKFLPLRASS
jgi:DNA-directed RNA polymerase specialized sigma24 family protein